jgi:toxin FitB
MILLDTNVLSALMRDTPDPAVVEWLDKQPVESVWTTSVTIFEIRTGIELLAPSRRRDRLDEAFSELLDDDLGGRVQVFDLAAAIAAGTIAATRQRLGRAVEIRDVQIAGIGASRHATVATRNTRHFDETGVDLVNPWGRSIGDP